MMALPWLMHKAGRLILVNFPLLFLQSINLYDGGFFTALMPARSYSYAALLGASTVANFPSQQKRDWRFG
jgi:hypothetical protein